MFFGILIVVAVVFVFLAIMGTILEKKKNALLNAVKNSDIQTAKKLIEKGADTNFGCPLVIAVENNNKDLVELLIAHGANVNSLYEEKTPLDFAKNKEIVNILKNHGAKTNAELQKEAKIQFDLGLRYHKGDGVTQDNKKAFECFKKAAEFGNVDAQGLLAACYFDGIGTEKNYTEAVKWSQKPAEKGNPICQYNLGVCYFDGLGCSKDTKKAVEWYEKAADQGYAPAQYNLGLCYYDGDGFDGYVNYEKAGELFEKAAAQGYTKAQNLLNELRQKGLY